MTNSMQAMYLLTLARNISIAQLQEVEEYLGNLAELTGLSEENLQRLPLSAGTLRRLSEARAGCDPAADLPALREQGIRLIPYGDPAYPDLLSQCSDAPIALFCRGRLEILEGEGIAVVGSRKCSERALKHAWNFGCELGECGLPVISGLALGVDG